jgi:hypothetical protein
MRDEKAHTLDRCFWYYCCSCPRCSKPTCANKVRRYRLFIPKTLIPAPEVYLEIMESYDTVVIAEENINNQFSEMFYGIRKPKNHRFIGSLGKMITPQQIIEEVQA